jgi:hypothetical protein
MKSGHVFYSTIFGAFINPGVLHGQSVIINDSGLGNGSIWAVLIDAAVLDHARNRVPAFISGPYCAPHNL